MNDTSPEIAKKVHEMMQQKTPSERLMMGCAMNATARRLVTEGILHNNPNISLPDLLQEIFLRFYGSDFSDTEKEKIIDHIKRNSLKTSNL